MIASAGFVAGQAMQRDKNAGYAALNDLIYSLPLPSVEPIADATKAAVKTLGGEPTRPRGLLPLAVDNPVTEAVAGAALQTAFPQPPRKKY